MSILFGTGQKSFTRGRFGTGKKKNHSRTFWDCPKKSPQKSSKNAEFKK